MTTSVAEHRPRSAGLGIQAIVGVGAALVAAAGTLVALPFLAERPALLPVLIVVGAIGVFLLLRPAWILPALVGVTFTSIGDSFFGGLPSPIEAGAAAFLVVAAWQALRRREHARQVLFLASLFALPLIASALLHPSAIAELWDLMKRLAFLPIVALCLRGRADVERTVVVLALVGVVLGLGGAWSVLVGPTALFPVQLVEGQLAPRASGPFGEPTFFALSLAVLMPLALSLVVAGGRRRWLGYASALAVTAGVFATGSRGALIAILFSLAMFAFAGDARRLRLAAVVVVLAVVALIPVFAGQAAGSAERTISGRATENLIAIQMFADHPVAGVGPGEYAVLYRDYSRQIGDDDRYERAAHSLPLEIAAEQGIVGLVAWLAAAAFIVRIAIRHRVWGTPVGKGLLLCLGTFAFESLFQHGSQLRIFYMLVGALLALAWALPRDGGEPAEAPR